MLSLILWILSLKGAERLSKLIDEGDEWKVRFISGALQAGSLALGGPIKGAGTRAIKEAAESQISGAVEDYVGVGMASLATLSNDRSDFTTQLPKKGVRHEAQATGATLIAAVLLGGSVFHLVKKKANSPNDESTVIVHPFTEGGSAITTQRKLDDFSDPVRFPNHGPPSGMYVTTRQDMNDLLTNSRSRTVIEQQLGLNPEQ